MQQQKARMYFCVPRSMDIYLKCLMLVDFIHGIIDISAYPSMSISTSLAFLLVKPEQFLCNFITNLCKFQSNRMIYSHHTAE